MKRFMWGIKSMITGENKDVFSHEQLVVAEKTVKLLEFSLHTINMIISSSGTTYDIRPVGILFNKIKRVSELLNHCIDITYSVQGTRSVGFTERPATIINKKTSALPPTDMTSYAFHPDIKNATKELLEKMRADRSFTMLIGVNDSIDRFLPAFEKELEQVSK